MATFSSASVVKHFDEQEMKIYSILRQGSHYLSKFESKFPSLYSIKLKLIKLNTKLRVSNITEIHRVNKPIAQG